MGLPGRCCRGGGRDIKRTTWRVCSRGVVGRTGRRRNTAGRARCDRGGPGLWWGVERIADELGSRPWHRATGARAHGTQSLAGAPRRPVQRYEKTRPGELLHLDLKYLPALEYRPEFEYAAIDDFSREGLATIARERSTVAATRFLEHVLAQLPYRVEAVMTDNDMMFTMRYALYSNRLTRFQQALKSAGIEHRLIRPRTPESNGKVERFIKTIDDECFRIIRPQSLAGAHRRAELFLEYYNHARPHQSLGGESPVTRRDAYFAKAGRRNYCPGTSQH